MKFILLINICLVCHNLWMNITYTTWESKQMIFRKCILKFQIWIKYIWLCIKEKGIEFQWISLNFNEFQRISNGLNCTKTNTAAHMFKHERYGKNEQNKHWIYMFLYIYIYIYIYIRTYMFQLYIYVYTYMYVWI